MADRRATVLVLDACGVGALPGAADDGYEGTNTLAHIAEALGGLHLPTPGARGLGSIVLLTLPCERPSASGAQGPAVPSASDRGG